MDKITHIASESYVLQGEVVKLLSQWLTNDFILKPKPSFLRLTKGDLRVRIKLFVSHLDERLTSFTRSI